MLSESLLDPLVEDVASVAFDLLHEGSFFGEQLQRLHVLRGRRSALPNHRVRCKLERVIREEVLCLGSFY